MVSPVPIGGRKLELQIADQEHALNVYEAAFRKIKDATGVSNVDDVIRKVIGQESTTDNLNSLTAQNQSKMENLRGLQAFLAEEVEKLKHSCVPGSYKIPKTLDEQHKLLYLRCISHGNATFYYLFCEKQPIPTKCASFTEPACPRG